MTAQDRSRYRKNEFRGWYNLKIWRGVLRPNQLAAVPWCEPCKRRGRVTRATVVNHRDPHKGDWEKFADPANLESSCKTCHDAAIQRAEGRGFRVTPGADGWPADPAHPFNKKD